ncbi:MAG: type II secretion system protein [Candidatus Firestonebacteria bacterium]
MEKNIMNGKKGFTFVATIFAVIILGIVATSVITITSTFVKREKEEELIYRLTVVREALKTYRTKTKRYPSHLDELVTNKHIRNFCLIDPITNKEWEVVNADFKEGLGIKDIHTKNDDSAIKLKDGRKVKLNEW